MEADPTRTDASKDASGTDHIVSRPVRGVWSPLKASFGFLFWGDWNRFESNSESLSEPNLEIIPAVLQVAAGMVLGVLPFLLGELWADSGPIGRGGGPAGAFYGSIMANVIAFLVAMTFHGIAIPFLLHFKRHFVAAGIGLFYGIGVFVLLGKVALS